MTTDTPPTLEELRNVVARYAAGAIDSQGAYLALGKFIDAAGDAGDAQELELALGLADRIEPACAPVFACLVIYARANAWASLRVVRTDETSAWAWDQPELLQEIYWLRSAIQHPGFEELPKPRRAQILCNLGNALSAAGRFVDATSEWRHALAEQPELGMAHGNLGEGLIWYARLLYDPGHSVLFLQQGRNELAQAVAGGIGRDGGTYPDALNHFRSKLLYVEEWLRANNAGKDFELKVYQLGRSKQERNYREWALSRRLFLNPLNDLFPEPIAAQDVLMLPTHRATEAGITFLAFYNQLKQEYAFARWSLFEGRTRRGLHIADKNVALAFNADYAQYSTAIEQIKTAFRCAYSLFDKIAYFVNDYWKLGIPERQVNFRSVWVEPAKDKGSAFQVRPPLEATKNFPLRGLYWISKDLFDASLKDVAQPNAMDLDKLRNHLEHKYVKVVDAMARAMGPPGELFADRLAHQVEREELERRTERLLQLVRSALIYLSLAMHLEEKNSVPEGVHATSLEVELYPERLKR